MGLSTVTRYEKFDTSIVSDSLDEHGIDGVITGLSPAHPDHCSVGRAKPMRFTRVDDPGDQTNFPFEMLDQFERDAVLVINGVDDSLSCWGGRASQLAAAADVNGVVIDGGYRDTNDIHHSSFPVFGSAPTPRTGQRRVEVTSTDDPVSLDGVTVEPGDIVVADSTGVVVVPAAKAEAVIETAEQIFAEELLIEEKIENGATVDDLRDHTF